MRGLGVLLGVLVANYYGLHGWKRATVIAGLIVGGAIVGAFLGPIVYNLARSLLAAKATIKSVALMNYLNFTSRALDQMKDCGISSAMVRVALKKGQPFWDPKNNTIVYILRNGFASGKHLVVAVNPLTRVIVTVIRESRLSSRFIPI